ncbi:hypothetical protein EJ110_NYTH13424 [Nymphaea thermarum]|nr:hypothetical protein EJ110_NYTH13424 [Nymphaea thermarum]
MITIECIFIVQVAKATQESALEIQTYARYKYLTMTKPHRNFKLRIVEGEFTDSQIIVAETAQKSAEEIQTYARYKYPTMTTTHRNFKLHVVDGEFTDS